MKSGRLEAFSDAFLAIVITIMVLEMKAPEDARMEALVPLLPVFLSYLISFIYLGIYWNNHHHLFQVTEKVNGKVLWANLFLMFWLSLIPFVTSYVGENHLASLPVALYGVVLLMSSISYRILEVCLIKHDDDNSYLKGSISQGIKENLSTILYITAIPLAYINIWIAIGLYALVAGLWFIPDKRVENTLKR